MTRAQYETKYGVKPVMSSSSNFDISVAPRVMTQAQYDAEFGVKEVPKPDNKFIDTSFGSAKRTIASTFQSGVGQMKDAFSESLAGRNPIETGAKLGAGAVGALFSPLAPVFKPIGGALDSAQNVISDIPAVQNFANTEAGAATIRVAEFVSNVSSIADVAVGVRVAPKVVGETRSVIGSVGDAFEKRRVLKLADEINAVEQNYSKLRKANDFSKDSGSQSRQRIAQTDVLSNSVDSAGTIRTTEKGGAVDKYRAQTIDGSEGVVRENLVREGKKVNINQVETELISGVFEKFEGADLTRALSGIKKEIEGLQLRADEFGNILLEKIHDTKISTTRAINYRVDSNPSVDYKKIKARIYKKIVENNSDIEIEVGGKKYGVEGINAELAKYYGDIERLQDLDGRKVKGGKLGKYSAQISGNLIGGAAGSVFGPAGAAIGGALGGEAASFLKGKSMSKAFGAETGKMLEPNPVLTRARELAGLPKEVNLQVPDVNLGASKSIPKTKAIFSIENQIKKNVEAQKKAIKAGDFTLVTTLKEVYAHLVAKLKALIQAVKDTPNRQGGFIKNPLGQNALPEAKGKAVSPQLGKEIVPSLNSSISKAKFNESTKGMFNSIREVDGVKIGSVMFHNKPWKVVDTTDFNTIAEISYKPLAEFRTRDELFSFLKNNQPITKSVSSPNSSISAKEAIAKGMTEDEWVKGQTNAQHGTFADFSEFKKVDPKKGEAVYLSQPNQTKAKAMSSRKGAKLMDVAIDESRVKTFDTQNPSSEQISITQDVVDKIYGKGKYIYNTEAVIETGNIINKVDDILQNEIIKQGSKQGYNDFRFWEPSAQEYSRAITDNSLIKTSSQLRAEYQAAKKANK